MKITLFVTFTVLIPWASCPSSFTNDRSQIFLSGTLAKCIYSWATSNILWLTVLASLICSNCADNAKFGTGFFLHLGLKLELGPTVFILGGFIGRTLGGDTGTSGIMMCGTEGGMWTLLWRYVGMFPSSSSMILGRSEGICWAHVERTWQGRGVYLVTGCFCGGSNGWCRLALTLEKYLRVDQ